MDVSQYLEIFLDETKEHLQNLNTRILELEQDSENMDTINEIFRAAHSLKGMAGTMGYKRMQTLTHDMENVFSEVRNGNIKVNSDMIDVLFHCLDALEEYTNNIQATADEGTNDNADIIKQLNDILNGAGKQEEKKEAAPAAQPEVSAASVSAESSTSGDKWDAITLDDSQVKVIKEAQKQNKKVYGLNVVVNESCILKAARAFLVFKAVEELAEIIVSEPSAQDVEDEKFDRDFTLIVLSDAELDKVIKAAESVSEIDSVTGAVIDLKKNAHYRAEEEKNEEKAEEAKSAEAAANQEAAPKAAPAASAQAPAPAAAKPAETKKQAVAKPVVNRTVRVDIEKLDSLMNLVSELIIAKNSLVSVSNQAPRKASLLVSKLSTGALTE